MQVQYLSECDKDYAAGLKAAQTFDDLRDFVKRWRLLANDAYNSVNNKKFDWEEFVAGRKMENRDEYAGDKWAKKYGAILMPEILMRVSIYAMQFGAPWGVTYIRLREFGRVVETKTHAVWVEPERDAETEQDG